MKGFVYSATLTGLAFLAFGALGAFITFAVCALVVGPNGVESK